MSERLEQGQCRCGAVRLKASGAPLVTMACHCRGCQLMTSSAFSLSSLYPAGNVQVEGETVRGGLKAGPNHQFCPSCMSWLFTTPDGLENFVNVRSSLFDNAAEHRPYLNVWTDEGIDWAKSGAPRSYAGVPEDSDWNELIADYAGWDGKVKP